MSDPVLRTQGLSRRFGGLMAASNVAIQLQRGKLHALLGPNGAGKTTLINLLSGELRASSGSISYKGDDITGYSPDRRSRIVFITRGIARQEVLTLWQAGRAAA